MLRGAVLDSTTLEHASLCSANLWRANLAHADLSYADLHDALAAGASFYETNLYGANLAGAVLDSAYFGGATVDTANMRDIVRTGWDTSGATLKSRGAIVLRHREDRDSVHRRYLPVLPPTAANADTAFRLRFEAPRPLADRLLWWRAASTCK